MLFSVLPIDQRIIHALQLLNPAIWAGCAGIPANCVWCTLDGCSYRDAERLLCRGDGRTDMPLAGHAWYVLCKTPLLKTTLSCRGIVVLSVALANTRWLCQADRRQPLCCEHDETCASFTTGCWNRL